MSRQQDRWQERMKVKAKNQVLSLASHKQLGGNDKERAQHCGDAVKLALEKYGCDLIPQIVLTPGNVDAAFLIKAKPRASALEQAAILAKAKPRVTNA